MSISAIEYGAIAQLIGKMLAEESERNKAAEGVLIGKIDGLNAMVVRSIKRADGLKLEFESIAKAAASEVVGAAIGTLLEKGIEPMQNANQRTAEALMKAVEVSRDSLVKGLGKMIIEGEAKAAADLAALAAQLREEIDALNRRVPQDPGQR